jgi:hypothetical protein
LHFLFFIEPLSKESNTDNSRQYISKFDPTQQILRVHNIDDTANIPYIVSESQLRLDFQNGPTFAAELIETPNDQYLFLIAHHLSIDLVSWRVILQDLEDLVLGRADFLPKSSMSFQAWVARQAEYSQQLEPSVFLQQQQRLQASDPVEYWGLERGFVNTSSDVIQQSFVLDKTTSSSLLRDSNIAFNTKPVDIFLAALATSFAQHFLDRDPPTVFLEGHGREPWSTSIDILRTGYDHGGPLGQGPTQPVPGQRFRHLHLQPITPTVVPGDFCCPRSAPG